MNETVLSDSGHEDLVSRLLLNVEDIGEYVGTLVGVIDHQTLMVDSMYLAICQLVFAFVAATGLFLAMVILGFLVCVSSQGRVRRIRMVTGWAVVLLLALRVYVLNKQLLGELLFKAGSHSVLIDSSVRITQCFVVQGCIAFLGLFILAGNSIRYLYSLGILACIAADTVILVQLNIRWYCLHTRSCTFSEPIVETEFNLLLFTGSIALQLWILYLCGFLSMFSGILKYKYAYQTNPFQYFLLMEQE